MKKRFIYLLIIATAFLLNLRVYSQQLDSAYSFNCNGCGDFITFSVSQINLTTQVDTSTDILPDTSTISLAQFSNTTSRKTGLPSNYAPRTQKILFNIYPNPARKDYYINIQSNKAETIELKLVDLFGREITKTILAIKNGRNVFRHDAARIPNGSYLIVASFSTTTMVKSIVVQR